MVMMLGKKLLGREENADYRNRQKLGNSCQTKREEEKKKRKGKGKETASVFV